MTIHIYVHKDDLDALNVLIKYPLTKSEYRIEVYRSITSVSAYHGIQFLLVGLSYSDYMSIEEHLIVK